ncbi:Nucleolar protein of 40 kDa [Mortierella sp. AD011]|nr:Nucleolar protein of 40 kDa [Mortierella sp. AD010]KAF9402229.1 Nucleolar protein of 40 kDa [Mortierella sp. AD011]
MESQQAAFEKFKAAGAGKKFSHERRNAEGTSSIIEGPVPDLYSIHHGKVVRIEGMCNGNFGAFVQIPGYKRHGLVFKNQASKHFTQHISDVVAVGDQVWVKVTNTQDNKIALSMKYVSQGDGTDLDPNLVQFMEEQDKKRVHSGFVDKRPISVEDGGVLLKTVCKKCGAAGHLATECFSGGERFDLLEDDDDDQGTVRAARPSVDGKEKRKKDKHESRSKDKQREKSKDKDKHRHDDYDREKGKESRRDHRDRNESSSHRSHRKEKRRDRSRSPKRRSDGPRVTKVESLEDALAVMRARKHRHGNDSSEESAEEKRERKRSDRKRRSRSRSRSRSPRRSDDHYDRHR